MDLLVPVIRPDRQIPAGCDRVGTNQLANTTMETYQQGTNCFVCHNNPTPTDPKGDLGLPQGSGLSHIFGEIQSLQ